MAGMLKPPPCRRPAPKCPPVFFLPPQAHCHAAAATPPCRPACCCRQRGSIFLQPANIQPFHARRLVPHCLQHSFTGAADALPDGRPTGHYWDWIVWKAAALLSLFCLQGCLLPPLPARRPASPLQQGHHGGRSPSRKARPGWEGWSQGQEGQASH